MDVCQTQRLSIRQFKESDAEFILELLNEEAFIQNINDKQVRNTSDAINYLRSGPMASYQKYGYGLYLVQLKDTKTPIGMCGFLKRDDFEYADIGYSLLEAFWSKGYAKEAAIAVLDYAHKTHHLTTVLAATLPSNIGSISLLEKLGFSLKGTLEMYGEFSHLYQLTLPQSN